MLIIYFSLTDMVKHDFEEWEGKGMIKLNKLIIEADLFLNNVKWTASVI